MNERKQVPVKDFEEMVKTPLGAFVVIITNTLEVLEKELKNEDDEIMRKHATLLQSTNEKISKSVSNDSFWQETGDIKQILNLCDNFTEEERNEALLAIDTFLSDLDDAMTQSRGKMLKKQNEIYDTALYVFNEIQDNYKTFATDQPFYDSLEAVFKELIDLYSDTETIESDEDREWFAEALTNVDFFQKEIKRFNKEKSFEQNLFFLYDSLDDAKKDFFNEDVVDFGIDVLTETLNDLQNEYEGLDVDLSKQENTLAAIKQIKRKLQKKYKV